jgi:hypothetical protein
MDRLIVFLDDAPHAWGVIEPVLRNGAGSAQRQWILVACAPRVTHHVSKWVTHRARESWRGKWSDKIFAQIVPRLQAAGQQVQVCTGKSNMDGQADVLLREYGPARLIDARRPKLSPGPAHPQPAPSGPGGLFSVWLSMGSAGLLIAD